MTDANIAQLLPYEEGAILLGKHAGQLVGVTDDRHLLTVAGSRAGKSSTCLKPNLKRWPSSVLCIDPKGELAMETADARAAMGQAVYILDPFEEVKGPAAQYRVGFNPLAEIREGDPRDIVDNASIVADALILPSKGDNSDHWSLSAKNLLRGLILYMLAKNADAASLTLLRKLVNSPLRAPDDADADAPMSLSERFTEMVEDYPDDFGGVVAGVGGTMDGKPPNELGSIVSTAVEQTAFLDGDPMTEHLGSIGLPSMPSLRQLKRTPTTIYLVLPASRMATHFRWLRVVLTLALAALEREPMALPAPRKDTAPSVLFVLEEFPQLGYMRQIEAAAGLMAGYGVKLWTVLQDLSQLRTLYRDSWETFIGNAGVVQAFGNTDATTLEYISRTLGTRQITETQDNRPTPSAMTSGARVSSETRNTVPLLAPFEIALYGGRDTGRQFVMMAGKPPAYIERLLHTEV
ncbi:type IV secretory system conjugative DNA transfer family protein (plasmid) [Pelagovum pacificum]|nr:type IV secretory system conjugative DNA transfer family protein [Pelagovum pacificum]